MQTSSQTIFSLWVMSSGEQQDFLQCPPERHLLHRFAIRDHISAPLCTQLDFRPFLPDSLQARLSDVPAEVHLDLFQTIPMGHNTFLQAAVSDADTVLQVEAA